MKNSSSETNLKMLLEASQAALQQFCQFPQMRKALSRLHPDIMPYLLAIGKDAGRMMEAALGALDGRTKDAVCLSKYGHYRCENPKVRWLEAGHPVPDENSILNTRWILNWLQNLPSESELIVLLSGGGSALFESPREGYSLQEIIGLNEELLGSGLDIAAMNARRAGLSQVKSGGALRFFNGKRLSVLAVSDVENDDARVISSGPFTPLEPDARYSFEVVGNNLCYREILAEKLKVSGLKIHNDTRFLAGQPDELCGLVHESLARGPGIYLWGGEIPIIVEGSGKGGRCTHLALLVTELLSHTPGALFVALATDGNDNLAGSSGAWTDSSTFARLSARGIQPEQVLKDADSFTALNGIGQIIPTGRYGVNVNDVFILLLP